MMSALALRRVSAPAPPAASSGGSSGLSKGGGIAGIVIGSVAALGLVIVLSAHATPL
jgi:hypothetical protein